MQFHGLFVGIDRYQHPKINWLGCAARDAVALRALFGDTFGTEPVLLTDEAATRTGIEAAMRSLASSAPEDFVVVAFSGHGTPTHELLVHDADPDRLAETALPLAKLTELFKQIPARHLVLVLDCCFSGGMGAKVLATESTARSMDSVEVVLRQIAGEGRLILTASTANQAAWENQRLGHGFLTHFLIEALRGAPEVVEASKIQLYKLLEHVTKRVESAATAIGKTQTPTVRGQLDGLISWPVFTPGRLFAAVFPEHTKAKVTADPLSLVGHGIAPEVIACWKGSIEKLNDLQVTAINEYGVLNGENVIVSAPTSSGKTMIGELATLRHVMRRRRALFLFPLKALVNDKHRHFTRTYGPYGIKTIRATGDSTDDVPALMRGRYDVCLMTYEKFSAMALVAPHLVEQLGVIVVDEAQMIADPSRGTNLEFLLTLLRVRRAQGIDPQLIALSAVIGDTHGLEQWLGGRLLRHEVRPVPLDEGVLTAAGAFRFVETDTGKEKQTGYIQPEYRKGSSQDWIVPLVRRLVREGKQVIVFRETKGEAQGCARYLAEALGLPPATDAIDDLPTGDPSGASEELRNCLKRGVAFHISDLDRDERLVVEEHFRQPSSKVRVIAATTTLAMGVNTPAEAVVIAGLMHPGDVPYSVAEYKNIAGRAGRLGFAARGASFLLASSPMDEHNLWARYVKGTPEDLRSRFFVANQDVRSLVLRSLVATVRTSATGLTEADVIEFLRGSFGAFQRRREQGVEPLTGAEIRDALANLEQHALVRRSDAERFEPTDLGRFAGEAGVEVESVTRLVDALRPLSDAQLTDPTLVAATQVTVELDNVYMPQNKKSIHKEPQTWFGNLARQAVSPHVTDAIRQGVDTAGGVARAKRASACLLWMSDTPLAQVEKQILQHGGGFDAAGPIRNAAARTFDLLGTTIRVAQILHPNAGLEERATRLMARLEVGAPADLIDLVLAVGSTLTRGNYHAVRAAGLNTVAAVMAAPDETILRCLDGDDERLEELRAALRTHVESQRASGREKPRPLADYAS